MELHNRRLLLLNEDVPINSEPPPPPSSSMFSTNLQLPPRPIFTSHLAYVFLILFTTVFFLGFVLLYIRHFSSDSDAFRSPIYRRNSSSGDAADNPLPELPYRGGSKLQQVECAICLDEFCEGETVKKIPYCKHVFHPECIDTWLVAHVTCPVCRCEKTCCEVGRVECGSVEERGGEGEGEEGREVGFESVGEAVTETRIRGSSSGSRIGIRRSVSF